jgi:glyoxylase-like metal-dependent hydrolase (beta-lactamase superfamily II)
MGRADWEGNPNRGQTGTAFARLELIDRLGLLDFVDAEREIVPGVTMLHAPGESPGHCIVRVTSNGERFYALGDVVHHAAEIAHPSWRPPQSRSDELVTTRERIFDVLAREGALAMTTHEPFPPWGRVVAAGNGYRWQRG